jgi:molecular chaperone HtpG
MSQKQTLSFQAEVAQLLHLVTHSLYSNKEIFLRELISNASDACDKLRFEALHHSELYEDAPTLEIRVSFDKDARTLTVSDNGIGLSEQEAIENLGTIAKSGTREFMSKLSGDQKADAQLIGQFGVGFYSGFIVADKITVESRRAGLKPEEGVRWTSAAPATSRSRRSRGRSAAPASRCTCATTRGLPVHLEAQVHHRQVLRPHLAAHPDAQGGVEGRRGRQGRRARAHRRMGDGQPGHARCGARPKKDITPEQYQEFYKAISHDTRTPLAWSHNRVEGSTEYTQLLYVPAHARPSTCGTATRRRVSASTCGASSSWTRPRR